MVALLSAACALVNAAGCGARSELSASGVTDDVSPSVPCQTGTFALRRANPALMFVIDRSRSMLEPVANAGGRSRWRVLSSALSNTLPPVDAFLEIGALVFPIRDASQASGCMLAGAPDLLPALHHVQPLLNVLNTSSPAGSTPSAEAVSIAANALRNVRAAKSARALVLATDGAPDCNSALRPSTCTCVEGARSCTATRCLDDKRSVERISQAAAEGIPTYVIGIQDANVNPVSAAALDAMARAGQRPQPGGEHSYYAATSEAELRSALEQIRDQVGSCTYLTSSVPDEKGSISVTLNGSELVFDASGERGWNWAERKNGEIVLTNEACAIAQLGDARVEAQLTCTER
jgi:hypothetical protein